MIALWIIAASIVCGSLIAAYTFVAQPINLIFSFGALIFMVYLFRKKFLKLSHRIWFVALTILSFFLFIVIAVMIQFVKSHPGGV